MVVLNEPDRFATYDSGYGQANIDLTLASGSIASSIRHWKINAYWCTSDDRCIVYNINIVNNTKSKLIRYKRFNIKTRYWRKFDIKIKEVLEDEN